MRLYYPVVHHVPYSSLRLDSAHGERAKALLDVLLSHHFVAPLQKRAMKNNANVTVLHGLDIYHDPIDNEHYIQPVTAIHGPDEDTVHSSHKDDFSVIYPDSFKIKAIGKPAAGVTPEEHYGGKIAFSVTRVPLSAEGNYAHDLLHHVIDAAVRHDVPHSLVLFPSPKASGVKASHAYVIGLRGYRIPDRQFDETPTTRHLEAVRDAMRAFGKSFDHLGGRHLANFSASAEV